MRRITRKSALGNVPAERCRLDNTALSNLSGETYRYPFLSDSAQRLEPPETATPVETLDE
jgi:hypothetical protein